MKESVYIDEDFESLVPLFLKNQYVAIDELIVLIRNDDYEGIKFIVHKIKGSAENFGFLEIGKIGSKMEALDLENETDRLINLAESMMRYIKSVHIEYIEM